MEEHLDFLIDAPEDDRGGIRIPWSVFVSLILHVLVITWIVKNYRPIQAGQIPSSPIVHYVELMRQQPKEFTEAPGPKSATASLAAPMSDANRRASMPKPTGEQPTTRPGDGTPIYVPHNAAGDGRRPQPASPPIQQSPQTPATSQQAAAQASAVTQELMQHSPNSQQVSSSQQMQPYRGTQANGEAPNLRQAIREVSRVASLGGGGGQGPDLGNAGGDRGYAAEGPLSFETQWYDWGEYAEGMVSRIRVNWYANMPMPLLQTGLKGVVTIRFTIHRDGHISDITILSSSAIPPYDFAAKKAIELSSPLNPLPKDFPEETERVTCMFFYNQEPPKR
jgi:TonB family protein